MLLLATACSSDDDSNSGPSCDEVAANDPAGQACGESGCPSVDCVCDDGSSVSLSSCFNGTCVGASACVETCSQRGGWACEDQSSNNQNNTGGGMFDCNGQSCDSASSYCLTSATSDGDIATSECVALPDGCSACGCASDDAPDQFPTSNNCNGVVACSSSNGQITVECLIPSSF